jgi:hypothetical protein
MNLGIDNVTIGVSSQGMTAYLDEVRAELLQKSCDLVRNTETVVTAVNGGWQGNSQERFLRNLHETTEIICNGLEQEYLNLTMRLRELEAYYFNQDNALIPE